MPKPCVVATPDSLSVKRAVTTTWALCPVTSTWRPDFPVDLPECSELQRKTWLALREIPRGETRSYGWLARHVGEPQAPRAIGAAVGANPVSLLVPCHRVVGANGALTGFAWGLALKRTLLDHERGAP